MCHYTYATENNKGQTTKANLVFCLGRFNSCFHEIRQYDCNLCCDLLIVTLLCNSTNNILQWYYISEIATCTYGPLTYRNNIGTTVLLAAHLASINRPCV